MTLGVTERTRSVHGGIPTQSVATIKSDAKTAALKAAVFFRPDVPEMRTNLLPNAPAWRKTTLA
jgi:hypothetical protein